MMGTTHSHGSPVDDAVCSHASVMCPADWRLCAEHYQTLLQKAVALINADVTSTAEM